MTVARRRYTFREDTFRKKELSQEETFAVLTESCESFSRKISYMINNSRNFILANIFIL